ncbi:MAG: hypothetical protein AAB909_00310 [Patescibacteria group bacterium]
MQDLPTQFFFVSAGVGVWVGVGLLVVVGTLLIKMLTKFNHVADEVKQTVDEVASIKSKVGEVMGGFVSSILSNSGSSPKRSKSRGGVSRGRKQKRK